MWCWLVMFLPAWLLQNIVHEASHLFFAWLDGRKPLGLYPFPHHYQGRFYFARCAWEKGLPLKPKSMIMAAPLVGVLMVEAIIALPLVLLPSLGSWLFPFAVCALIDGLWWTRGLMFGTPYSDAQRWLHGDPK